MTFALLTMLRQDGDCATVVNRSLILIFNNVGGGGGGGGGGGEWRKPGHMIRPR